MALELSTVAPGPVAPEGLEVREATTPADIEAFARINAENWEPPDADVEAFYRTAAARLLAGDSPQKMLRCASGKASPSPRSSSPSPPAWEASTTSRRGSRTDAGESAARSSNGRAAPPRRAGAGTVVLQASAAGREPLSVLRLSGVRPDRGAQALPFVASDKIYYVKYDIRPVRRAFTCAGPLCTIAPDAPGLPFRPPRDLASVPARLRRLHLRPADPDDPLPGGLRRAPQRSVSRGRPARRPVAAVDRRSDAADGLPARRPDRPRPACGRLRARGPRRLRRGPGVPVPPVLGAAAALSLSSCSSTTSSCPATNALLERSMARVAATSIVNVVAPRTFREPRPGITFFFDRVARRRPLLRGHLPEARRRAEAPNRIIVARRGGLTLEGDRLWLDLFESTVHEVDPQDASRYRTSRNASQRLLLAGESVNAAGTRVDDGEGDPVPVAPGALRSGPKGCPVGSAPPAGLGRDPQEVRDPLRVPRLRARRDSPRAVVAARRTRRRLRALARDPRRLLRPPVDGRNLGSEGACRRPWRCGCRTSPRRPRGRRGPRRRERRAPAAPAPRRACALGRRACRRRAAARGHGAVREPRPALSLARRPVRSRAGSCRRSCCWSWRRRSLISLVVDYADKLDEVARHTLRRGGVRLLPVLPAVDHDPDRPVRGAAGHPRRPRRPVQEQRGHRLPGLGRVAAAPLPRPVIVAAGARGGARLRGRRVRLPFAEQRQARYKNEIYGHPRTPGGRGAGRSATGTCAPNGEIWHREEARPGSQALFGVSIFSFDKSSGSRAGPRRARPSGRTAPGSSARAGRASFGDADARASTAPSARRRCRAIRRRPSPPCAAGRRRCASGSSSA